LRPQLAVEQAEVEPDDIAGVHRFAFACPTAIDGDGTAANRRAGSPARAPRYSAQDKAVEARTRLGRVDHERRDVGRWSRHLARLYKDTVGGEA